MAILGWLIVVSPRPWPESCFRCCRRCHMTLPERILILLLVKRSWATKCIYTYIYIYLNDPKCKNGCERVVSSCRLFGSTNLNSIQLEPSIYLLIGSMCWFTWSMVPICSKDATLNELTRWKCVSFSVGGWSRPICLGLTYCSMF